MKHSLLSLFLVIACSGLLNAQIVVDRSDFPVIGNLVVAAQDRNTVVEPGNAGPNQTWNFGNLVATSYDSTYFIPVSQGIYNQNYPNANLAARVVVPEGGYSYGFYNDSGNDIGIAGLEVQAIIMPGFFFNIHMKYLTESWFHLPYHYGDTHTSIFTQVGYAASYSGGVMLDTTKTVSHVTSVLEVDGWGTMITPTGSFPVLRVKEEQSWADSSFTYNGGTWVFSSVQPRTNLSYTWYGKNYGPIGKIFIDQGRATEMNFFVSETVVDVKEVEPGTKFSVYPNPVTDYLTVNCPSRIEKIKIYDMSGSLKMVFTGDSLINVSKLTNGNYLMQINTAEGVTTSKFTKK